MESTPGLTSSEEKVFNAYTEMLESSESASAASAEFVMANAEAFDGGDKPEHAALHE